MKMNRLLVGVICASMAVAQLPVNALAETLDLDEEPEVVVVEEEEQTDLAEPSYTWEGFRYYYDSNTKTLTVEGEGELAGDYNLLHNDYVKGISSNLDKIVLNTRGAKTANQLFEALENIKEVDLSGFDSSKVTTMLWMFNCCRSLKTVNLSGVDTSRVTNMASMFENCESLETVDVTGFKTNSVMDMSYMFMGCSSLKTLDVSGFDTSNVTDMQGMFQCCEKLKTIDVSGFDTSNVTTMSDMFNRCESLESVDVTGFNTSNVKDMLRMFGGCSSLKSLNLSRFNTSNVTTMQFMFEECKNLTTLDLSSFDISNLTNMIDMFRKCESLENLDLSTWNVSKVMNLNKLILYECNSLQTFKTPYNNTQAYTLPVTMTDQNGKQYVKDKTPVKTTVSLTLKASGKQDDPDEPDDENYDHKLTLNGASDYNSVHVYAYNGNSVVHHEDLKKGESFGFNDGNRLVITGLGSRTDNDKNWTNYFVRLTTVGSAESSVEYGDGWMDKDGIVFDLFNRTEDIDITVEGKRLPISTITAKGKTEGPYSITATPASKKGDYINLTKHKDSVKVEFAVKKTGSLNYEIANSAATIRFGTDNPEAVTLSEGKNKYSYEIPFYDLAQLAYSETPSVEFTLNTAAKLPVPTAKVSASTDIDATLSLDVPKAAKDLTKLWYKLETKANVARNKTLPEGMADSVGPLYVPATVPSQAIYLMAEPGKKAGDGTAQKYDFTATLLQLENEPEYSGEPITDKSAVEGADGGNVVGVSTAKKVSGSTKKPGYEEKLGLNKKQISFIRGEGGDDGILLATAKYSKNTTFRSLSYAKITNASGEIVKSSDNEDDSKRIILDGDSIILEDTDDLTPGKYKLSVLPVSRIGSPLPKAATLALTVKQGIDELTVSVPQSSYVKKPKKALTIKPTVTYNGGDRKKAPAAKKVKWELLDADGNALTDANPLFGKVMINQKNGAVTVAKDLVISGDPSVYSFRIMATAADYEGNTTAAKTDVIELVSDEVKTDIQPVEMEIQIDNTSGITESDIHFFSGVISKSDGKRYVNGEELALRIADGTHSEKWVVSLEEGFNLVVVPNFGRQGEEEYRWFRSEDVRKLMKAGKKLTLKIVPNN